MKATVASSVVKSVLVCLSALFVGADVMASEFDDLVDMQNRANALRVAGRAREAIALADKLVARADEVFRDHPHNLSVCLETPGLIYFELGLYAKAEPLFKRVISIRTNANGNNDPFVAMGLNNLALLYVNQGRYAEAEPLHRRALAIREKVYGRDHYEVANSLNNLGLLFVEQDRFVEAEAFNLRALSIREKVLGKDHPDVAVNLNSLAELYWTLGRYADAEAMSVRSVAIRERAYGREHPRVAEGLYSLASIYKDEGRYSEAEPLYQRALAIWEKAYGKVHPIVATCISSVGHLYKDQGRNKEAEQMCQRALAIREETLSKEHPSVAGSLHDLAVLFFAEGRSAEAKPLYERALRIWENSLGKDHSSLAFSLQNLARLASTQGQYVEAEQLFQRALAIREKTLGKEHPHVADTLCCLAYMYVEQEKFAQAEREVERALAIFERADIDAQDKLAGFFVRAQLRWHTKKMEEGLADLNHALDLIEQVRGQASAGDSSRAVFFAKFAMMYELKVAFEQELGHPGEVLKTIERSRARSLIDQLATANIDLLAGVPGGEASALRTRQSTAKTILAQLEKQAESFQADTNLSSAQREHLTRELADKLHAARDEVLNAYLAIRNASPVYRQMVGKDFKPAGLADIQSQLVGGDGLLLEYFLGDYSGYVVIVPPAGGEARAEPLAVSKEQAASLGIEPGPLTDASMRAILSNEAGAGLLQQLREVSKAEATTARLAILWQVLVPETERKLLIEGKLKRCIVVPDAALAAFPFDTLVVELGEKPKYLLDVGPPIVTAPSATLLMNLMGAKATDDSVPSKKLLSVADPNYGVPSATPVAALENLSARSRYGALRGSLTPLPYTAWECSWVAETFRKAGLDAGVLQKANAREASVRMYAPGRKYLHFACHGLVDQSYGNLFGALALTPGPAGSSDSADDGFLTLAEIYELNLRGTELSILSACDTNYGPNQKGEGVWSLSRGFLVAGSKRVIASNWLVDDEAGASLVSVFCSELVKEKPDVSLDYASKLQAAKRWVRKQEKWQSPYYWGTFVLVGPN